MMSMSTVQGQGFIAATSWKRAGKRMRSFARAITIKPLSNGRGVSHTIISNGFLLPIGLRMAFCQQEVVWDFYQRLGALRSGLPFF